MKVSKVGVRVSAGSRRRGVAVVEFALVVPILLSMLLGIMEFGILTKNQLTLANASREGARSAALGRTPSEVRTRIKSAATPFVVQDSNITLQYSLDNGATFVTNWPGDVSGRNGVPPGSLLRVLIAAPNKSLTSFFPFLNNRIINVQATYRREA